MAQSKSFLHADEQDELTGKKRSFSDYLSLIALISHTKEHLPGYFLATFILLISTIMAIISAKFTGNFVEEGLLLKNYNLAWRFATFIIFFEFIHLLTNWWVKRLFSLQAGKTLLSIREKLIDKLHTLPLAYFDHNPQGRIVTRITHDVEGVENFFSSSLGRFLIALFMSIFSMIAMLLTHFKLGLLMILFILPSLLFIYATKNLVRKTNRNLSKTNSILNSKLSEFLSGMDVIRAFGIEKWSKKEYNKLVDEYKVAHLGANYLYSWTRPLTDFLTILPMIFLLYVGGKDVLSGTLSIGILVSFIRYYDRFYIPLVNLTREIHLIQQAFTSSERILLFLKERDENALFGGDGTRKIEYLDGAITFDNVSMRYDEGRPHVLKDVTFSVLSGQKIGLVGQTGSGKTTTISLLSRLYDYDAGEIKLDGIPIREISRSSLRKKIGLVTQDVMVFSGTLRENLLCSKELSDDEIHHATNTTGLRTIMEKNRLSLDSLLLEGGVNLSAGERQLLSLTRILLSDPSILILDEATANIDPYYEELVHKAIDKVMKGRTCLIIAHRLNTLKDVHRILVFKDGKIVEGGTLDELMQKRDYFYSLQRSSEALT